ncbi:MAG: hypothetical protein ACP5LG_06485 [Conexivisphaera sp.]
MPDATTASSLPDLVDRVMVDAVAAALAFVLLVEEPECRSRFGRDYHDYASSVPPFSLDPGCLARGLGFIRGLGREPHP